MGTIPSASVAIAVKAPTDMSIDCWFSQVGHSSATVTSTFLLVSSAR